MCSLKTAVRWVSLLLSAVLAFLLCGCGGATFGTPNTINGTVSGVVFDIAGNPVRGAAVTCEKSTTISNSAGSYVLNNIVGNNPVITAQVTVGTTHYLGQNSGFLATSGTQSKSVNITVINDQQVASITGQIYDRNGNEIGGAQVFAVAVTSGPIPVFSAISVPSDSCGNYTLSNLAANVAYTFLAAGQGYDSDSVLQTLKLNESRTINFNLKDPAGTSIAAPANVLATAYTSPAETSRSTDLASAVENIKRLSNPQFAGRHAAKIQSRSTPAGNYTEIDISWDAINNQSLLGYGVYRGKGTKPPTMSTDVLEDPLANFFADLDAKFQVGDEYTYAVTSINTLYGSSGGAESTPSAPSTATILGDLNLAAVNPAGVVFNWQAATGAAVYAVYLFDQYPSIGVAPIWNNDASGQLATGTSQNYTGTAPLVSGKTYYYIVIGRSSDRSGVTISRVDSFVKS